MVFQHELDHLHGVLHIDREMKAFVSGSRDDVVQQAHAQYVKDLLAYYDLSVTSAQAPDDC